MLNHRLIQDLIQELFREFGAPVAVVVTSGITVWTNMRTQSVIPNLRNIAPDTKWIHRKTLATKVETSEKILDKNIDQTEKSLEQMISQSENRLQQQLEHVQQDVGNGINQAQALAAGAALIIVQDPKKLPKMQERLKVFAACVRGDGGESCLEGKQ